MGEMRRLLEGARIDPSPVTAATTLTELVDGAFLAYNGARLREAVQLFTRQLLADDVTIGLSMHRGRPDLDDVLLKKEEVVRIYDIVFDYENLLGTDKFFRTLCGRRQRPGGGFELGRGL